MTSGHQRGVLVSYPLMLMARLTFWGKENTQKEFRLVLKFVNNQFDPLYVGVCYIKLQVEFKEIGKSYLMNLIIIVISLVSNSCTGSPHMQF